MRVFIGGLFLFATSIGIAGTSVNVDVGSPRTIGPNCHNTRSAPPQRVMVPTETQVRKTRMVERTVRVPKVIMTEETVQVAEEYLDTEVREVPHILVPEPQSTYVPEPQYTPEPMCVEPDCYGSNVGSDYGVGVDVQADDGGGRRRCLARLRERRGERERGGLLSRRRSRRNVDGVEPHRHLTGQPIQ